MKMLKLLATAAVLLALTPQWVDNTTTAISHSKLKGHVLMKKRSALGTKPTQTCSTQNEGMTVPAVEETVWLCRSARWLPYRLLPSLGTIEEYAGQSCKDIHDAMSNDCQLPPLSGSYYINTTDTCTENNETLKVYCNMDDDGGGWTLVWKHSVMEVRSLTEDMKYFSDYYKACTDLEVGWCNIPNKGRLNPTEMMTAAYHKKTLVYAYKGIFNKNLDWHWSGGILLDPKKVVDQCTSNNGVQPAPYSVNNWGGLSFDKVSPHVYTSNCDVYAGSLSSPTDCRWENCQLPTSISSSSQHTQMTVAIYVR